MADTSKAGLRVREFLSALPIGRSALYDLPPEQQPRSVRLGRARVIIESPHEFLARIAEQQGSADRGSSGLYALVDQRADGTPRVVAQFLDPVEARAALAALRGAGDVSAELEIVAAVDPIVGEAGA